MTERSFEDFNLSEEIIRALDLLKYERPTKVQSEVIPRVLGNQDLIVKSQTGSGKTASFGIPLCEMIDWHGNEPQGLILTPTRELAVQVREDITDIGRFKKLKATAVFGKESFVTQEVELYEKTHIVIGTPGRVMDHIERETLWVDDIKYLIIDEADEMLTMGFVAQVEAILKQLPLSRLTMVFSATLPQNIVNLCRKYMSNPINIEIASTGVTTNTIEHHVIEVNEAMKMALLKNLMIVENPKSCIIFCKTKRQVDTVFAELEKANYSCEKIHGGIIQENRFAVMDGFKMGNFRYLVATDVAARGIDVDKITLVINYDVPLEKENYVHRTGRTGRANNEGKAITLTTPSDVKHIKAIEKYIGFEIPVMKAPGQQVATRLNNFEGKVIGRRKTGDNKSEEISKDTMTLHFNAGKKKKLRAGDFVGAILKTTGVTADDIGVITIQDSMTHVDILNDKGSRVRQAMEAAIIKGKKVKVSKALNN